MTSKLKCHKNYTEFGEPYQMMWKREVPLEFQEIYDRTSDQFIWDILVLTKQGFNSWKDEKSFNELQGGLRALFIFQEKSVANYNILYIDEEVNYDGKPRKK